MVFRLILCSKMATFFLKLLFLQSISEVVYSKWINEMENTELFQGDIVLDPDQKNPDGTFTYTASMKGGRWKNGVVPYKIHDSLKSEPQAMASIKAAIADYHKYTCIRFQPATDESEYALFVYGPGCSSPVGWKRGRINEIMLGKHCWLKGKVMHEMGHTMGFWHEQSRPDRDKYIKILWGNIEKGNEYNFYKFTDKEIDTLGTPYDLESMMHYSSALFSRNGKRTIKVLDYSKRLLIGQLFHFSNLDIKQLNLMYKCHGYKATIPPMVCKDIRGGYCAYVKGKGYCTMPKHENKMYRTCCKSCFGHVVREGGPHTWPPTGPTPTKAGGECIDHESKQNCEYWASLGNCKSKSKALRDFMKKKCCATCRDHR